MRNGNGPIPRTSLNLFAPLRLKSTPVVIITVGHRQYGGVVWPAWAAQAVAGGRLVWRPPLGRLSRVPRWRRHPGGARSEAARGDGAPLPGNRGAVWPARAHTGRAAGALGMVPPSAALSRAPRRRKHTGGGAVRRRGRRRGAPANVKGPINTRQAEPTGVGRGGRRLPAVTVPPPPSESRVSTLAPLSP